ncbi:AraC family transcriptional regulator [Streptomyces sp. NPDC004539]|uniref:AraC family transcriptional regulator n=1 Tax=Streptomyces sp. NPDC004539 TaxID=3154280 RepID=UPI0033B875A4
MVSEDDAIPRLDFNPPAPRVPGFEIVGLADLRRRRRHGVHRVDFHTLTLVTDGTGEHMVDFVTHPCRPGTLLWVRPGQVQHHTRPGTADGVHVLFTPAFPPPFSSAGRLLDPGDEPACRQLGASPEYAVLATLLGQLRAEYESGGVHESRGVHESGGVHGLSAADGRTASAEILRHLLATLLLQIDRLPRPDGSDPHAGGEVYARFRAELERSYATTRRAADYAHRLGYTVKTLTRACTAATGQPAKPLIDARVALEAQRLLAHTDEPAATIARRLGFPEPTNFGKFFTRQTGVTPGAFRETHRI